jgi:hypothetical protein
MKQNGKKNMKEKEKEKKSKHMERLHVGVI